MSIPTNAKGIKISCSVGGEGTSLRSSRYSLRRSKTISISTSPRQILEEQRRNSADTATLTALKKARRCRQTNRQAMAVQQEIKVRDETPYQKFRRISKTVRVIATIYLALKCYVKNPERKLWSLVEMHLNLQTDMEHFLPFDRNVFTKIRVDRGSEKLKSILTDKPERRKKEDIETVVGLLRGNKAFGNYSKETQISLAKIMYFVTYEHRRIILKEGHRPSCFYIILSGTCLVNQKETDYRSGTTFVRTVSEVSNGDSFGAEELLNDTIRRSTYICKNCVELLLINKEDFQKIVREPLERERDEIIEFCKSQDFFWGLPFEELRSNHNALTYKHYKPESVVLRNIKDAGYIAIIKSGKCKVVAEVVETKKRQNHCRISRWTREDWKTTAAPKSMSLFGITKKANNTEVQHDRIFCKRTLNEVDEEINHSSSFDKFIDVQQNIFIRSLRCYSEADGNPGGIQRTRKRLGLLTSSTAREVQSNRFSHIREEPVKLGNGFKSTYAQIAELGPGSVFGLDTILKKTHNKLSLVSKGAECILVSKKFLQNDSIMKILETTNTMTIDFPQPKETLTKIREGRAWVAFKDTVVTGILEGKSKKVTTTVNE